MKMKRCQGEQPRDVRKMLLGALNLEREPRASGIGMASLRELWKAAFKATAHGSTKSEKVTGVSSTSTPDSPGINQLTNSTGMHCCQLVSEIFIKDLGWEDWIVYPESFTYTQCTACTPKMESTSTLCRAHSPHSKGDCCRPMSQALLPFLYLDEFNTVVISSVQLTQECGCRPGNEPHPLQT
ncbi:hypothetical protein AAFF_G00425760 [Aldrovandia affinis]|uniref:TGF-beta family profile domain-containing protein n=1 Tax=Aldrovandia affinis TaxID=143900 RepID=A0AAD7T8L0_9TELE|nr:hypothetical protein AAFF_G00425760 [Aldrovandia affinis]